MKKLFYSVVITSLLAVGVAQAKEIQPMMVSGAPSSTPSHERGGEREMHPILRASSTMMLPPLTSSSSCVKFGRNLTFGTRGDDVRELQEMLHENGFLNGSSTGFFGRVTKEAVVKFQKDGGLNPSGLFGQLSRKHHEKRCGEGRGDNKDRGSGHMMGSSTIPFPPMGNGSSTCKSDDCRPTRIVCTMEARLCANGTVMPRDKSCGWHPEQCPAPTATTTASTSPVN